MNTKNSQKHKRQDQNNPEQLDELTSSALINFMELTELIKDYVATEVLSSIELDFLEGELWETTQHIAEINTVIRAPKNICEKLDLEEKSCWQLCCAALLDSSRPLKNGKKRVDEFKKLINQYDISYI